MLADFVLLFRWFELRVGEGYAHQCIIIVLISCYCYCYCLLLLFIVIVYCYCLLLLFIVIVCCYCLLLLLCLLDALASQARSRMSQQHNNPTSSNQRYSFTQDSNPLAVQKQISVPLSYNQPVTTSMAELIASKAASRRPMTTSPTRKDDDGLILRSATLSGMKRYTIIIIITCIITCIIIIITCIIIIIITCIIIPRPRIACGRDTVVVVLVRYCKRRYFQAYQLSIGINMRVLNFTNKKARKINYKRMRTCWIFSTQLFI